MKNVHIQCLAYCADGTFSHMADGEHEYSRLLLDYRPLGNPTLTHVTYENYQGGI